MFAVKDKEDRVGKESGGWPPNSFLFQSPSSGRTLPTFFYGSKSSNSMKRPVQKYGINSLKYVKYRDVTLYELVDRQSFLIKYKIGLKRFCY